jgi:hypothetical protein
MIISVSNTCSAFEPQTIGSQVVNIMGFWEALKKVIAAHDFTSDRIPGQAYLMVPEAIPFVSSGQGKHRPDPSAYVNRLHRGQVHAYLRRKYAEPVVEVAVVVYTRFAYLHDPDIFEGGTTEYERIGRENPDYVVVAVLAGSTKSAAMSPYRFVKNLAGGNHEALAWTAEEIRAKAREIAEQVDTWATVAD